ncbi:Uma2 family endonuclease [Acidaminobacter sp. JC074]|uniref:Uma2 family endonuclease n=1 Tax=Acidaminobacter sp. JC074 TaxID=2530199 RepID=UPI001F1134FC|nr:Uma2 family endonuclease [Acidaminobacter sp. JC074]MCH4886405.1 Uma2 family endonuclease [Acidaminobacter sp. JC074]
MIINATEVKNSFGKMLKLLDYEDIIVKKNGRVVAKIIKYTEKLDPNNLVKESIVPYEPKDRKVSYEEFLKLTANSENRYELLNGEIYLLASPKVKHQMAVGKLHGELCRLDLGGCVPFISPFDIKLEVDDKINVLQPDLGIICNLEKYTDEEDRYQGVPTLVVEVLSPSSISRDKVKKLNVYMLSGVEEYWIVDPIKERAYVYHFKDFEIENYEEFDRADGIKSFRFENLKVEW